MRFGLSDLQVCIAYFVHMLDMGKELTGCF